MKPKEIVLGIITLLQLLTAFAELLLGKGTGPDKKAKVIEWFLELVDILEKEIKLPGYAKFIWIILRIKPFLGVLIDIIVAILNKIDFFADLSDEES